MYVNSVMNPDNTSPKDSILKCWCPAFMSLLLLVFQIFMDVANTLDAFWNRLKFVLYLVHRSLNPSSTYWYKNILLDLLLQMLLMIRKSMIIWRVFVLICISLEVNMMKIHVVQKLRHSPLVNSNLEYVMVIRFGFPFVSPMVWLLNLVFFLKIYASPVNCLILVLMGCCWINCCFLCPQAVELLLFCYFEFSIIQMKLN